MMKNIRSLFIGLCMLMAGAVLYSCSDDDVVLSGSDVKSFAILGFEGTAQIDPYERDQFTNTVDALVGSTVNPGFLSFRRGNCYG